MFSRSSDMISAPRILWWDTWPHQTPIKDSLSSVGCGLHIQLYIKLVVIVISLTITKMHKVMQNVEIGVV